jgi:mannose-1-phosphate guanylyltransferase / mannose-6-phosphate isomerase
MPHSSLSLATSHIFSVPAKHPVIPVILCGGAGTRLWPLSRKHFPKPFLKVGDASLIAQTVQRAAAVMSACANEGHNEQNSQQNLLLVSNESYQFLLQDECAPVLDKALPGAVLHQILEPNGRNTAPAIALAALWSQTLQDGLDPILLVLPADHLISPLQQFIQAAQVAIQAALGGNLTCFGINPTSPETGFGYIQKGKALADLPAAYSVQRFVEKPSRDVAVEYLASGQYVWNGGMFAFKASDVLKGLLDNAPEVHQASKKVWGNAKTITQAKGQVSTFNSGEFNTLPDISIDYALMEKSSNVAVVPATFQWSDIGSWAALAEQNTADSNGNSVQVEGRGELINIDSKGTHVQMAHRTVATLGLTDILIVDTPDALLVADKSRHQDVKKVVEVLKSKGSSLVDFHPTVHRPWGTYTVLEDSSGYKIKRIEVKPGASLSLQMHHHRSEHWIVVSGTAEVTNGENVFLVRKNESTYIPAGNKHRLVNPGKTLLVMIEVQSGDYLEEDDIVRFDDKYGRA